MDPSLTRRRSHQPQRRASISRMSARRALRRGRRRRRHRSACPSPGARASAGMSVTLLERDALGPGHLARGRRHARAGRRGRVRRRPGGALLELGLRSAAMWPAFAAELRGGGGHRGGAACGRARCCSPATTTRRASSSASSSFRALARPARRAAAPERGPRARAGAGARRVRAGARGARRPLGRSAPGARRAAAARASAAGVRLREHAPVARRRARRAPAARVTGVRAPRAASASRAGAGRARGRRLERSRSAGLPGGARMPVRPVKGQILRLRDPAGPGLLGRVRALRGRLPGAARRRPLRARRDRRGARLRAARRPPAASTSCCATPTSSCPASPSSRSRSSAWGCARARPTTLRSIGPGALEGLIWATGHHRNGILLAPLTAELVARAARRRARAAEALLLRLRAGALRGAPRRARGRSGAPPRRAV